MDKLPDKDHDVICELELLKEQIGLPAELESADRWWDEFEKENSSRVNLVLKLVKELISRKASVTDFFIAYCYSDTDNIQANLDFLDKVQKLRHEFPALDIREAAKTLQEAKVASERLN